MNNKCTINVSNINAYDFKHNFSYRLLFHIMSHYDIEMNKVKLEPKEIYLTHNINRVTFRNSINELLDKGIIKCIDGYKYWYDVDYKLFLEFDKISNYTISCECKSCSKVTNYINYPNTDFLKREGWVKYNNKWFCCNECKEIYELDNI